MREIKVGAKYRHFKGNFYEVVAVARDSEDPQKEVVVYKALYDSPEFGPNQVWVRPKEEFLSEVTKDRQIVDRFEKID